MEKILLYFTTLLVFCFASCQAIGLNVALEQKKIDLPDILIEVKIPNSNKILVAYQKYKLAVVCLDNDKIDVKRIRFDSFNQHGDVYRKNSAREAVFQSTIQDIQISLNGRCAAILFEKENSKYVAIIDSLRWEDCRVEPYFEQVDKSNFKSMYFTPDNRFFIATFKNGFHHTIGMMR